MQHRLRAKIKKKRANLPIITLGVALSTYQLITDLRVSVTERFARRSLDRTVSSSFCSCGSVPRARNPTRQTINQQSGGGTKPSFLFLRVVRVIFTWVLLDLYRIDQHLGWIRHFVPAGAFSFHFTRIIQHPIGLFERARVPFQPNSRLISVLPSM